MISHMSLIHYEYFDMLHWFLREWLATFVYLTDSQRILWHASLVSQRVMSYISQIPKEYSDMLHWFLRELLAIFHIFSKNIPVVYMFLYIYMESLKIVWSRVRLYNGRRILWHASLVPHISLIPYASSDMLYLFPRECFDMLHWF